MVGRRISGRGTRNGGFDVALLLDKRLVLLEGDASGENLICFFRCEAVSMWSLIMHGDWISTCPCRLLNQTSEGRNILPSLHVTHDTRCPLDSCSLLRSLLQVLGIGLKATTLRMSFLMLDMPLGTDTESVNMKGYAPLFRKEAIEG